MIADCSVSPVLCGSVDAPAYQGVCHPDRDHDMAAEEMLDKPAHDVPDYLSPEAGGAAADAPPPALLVTLHPVQQLQGEVLYHGV